MTEMQAASQMHSGGEASVGSPVPAQLAIGVFLGSRV